MKKWKDGGMIAEADPKSHYPTSLALTLDNVKFSSKPEDVVFTLSNIVTMKIISLQVAPYNQFGFQAEVIRRVAARLLTQAHGISHPRFSGDWTEARMKEMCKQHGIPFKNAKRESKKSKDHYAKISNKGEDEG